MTALSSMLVPQETLPGWPHVADPTPLQTLGLLVGLPLVVVIAAFVIAKIGNAVKASRGTTNTDTDPVWVGGPTRPDIEGPRHDQAALDGQRIAGLPEGEVALAADGAQGDGSQGDESHSTGEVQGAAHAAGAQSAESGRDVGGAGARW
jgi:hypothetical protein